MDNCRLLELLGQAEASTTGEVFREFLRGGVRLMLADVLAAEASRFVAYRDAVDSTLAGLGSL